MTGKCGMDRRKGGLPGCWRSGEDAAELESKTLDVEVNLCSSPQLWTRALSSDQKNETVHKRD